MSLFETRFDPSRYAGKASAERTAAEESLVEEITRALDDVMSLDQDRIIRAFLGVIRAGLRTNYYQRGEDGAPKPYVSLKLNPKAVPDLPAPRPAFEIWVYSPRVEGVHLRFGPVARGGLRWSDRREDFRTEVLGLVKAQMVKNAVIVPTGSKGGFYAKQLPDPTQDRDAWLAEGVGSYKVFISGLLDITDNRVGGGVVAPSDVVRHDSDDPYLVVAADKGTATFSDIANGVAQSYGFWLDDAFASGGSAGYDHKAMGITARGAWESVKRHFREMGVDTQTEDFTAVGIGDMSGDVFGNGMLLSEHIRLVAAFDHRHIFIDPEPVAATSFPERQRLFELPRSSWADYDTALISAGGGVFDRTAKSVPVTPEMVEALGLSKHVQHMTPAELMKAILQAPVDLLWNGGIGTYVKAGTEENSAIGDRANDAIRVNGHQLRCRVVGEGGNLGLSQLGRIEAALHGVRVNTDAIDNSAGVDTSDHEVNIKILLTGLMREGDLTLKQRNTLLASMTDEVAAQVLRDNYEQNVLLGNARAQEHGMLTVHQRLMHWLEERGDLDRELEFLPSDAEIERRSSEGLGLKSPEFSVLVAYAKLALKEDLLPSELPDDPWFQSTLAGYFPEPIRERFAAELAEHPLRREIVTNAVVNSMVNRGGITFAFRAIEETGATPEQIARAFVVAREIFDLPGFVRDVEALDNAVTTDVQTQLYLEFRRLIDRAIRWFLTSRPSRLDVANEVSRFAGVVGEFAPRVPQMLRGAELKRMQRNAKEYEKVGVPEDLALRAASLLDQFSLLDIVDIATDTGESPSDVAPLYFVVSERFGIDLMLGRVTSLPRDDRWDALARGALRDDLYAVLESPGALRHRVDRLRQGAAGPLRPVGNGQRRVADPGPHLPGRHRAPGEAEHRGPVGGPAHPPLGHPLRRCRVMTSARVSRDLALPGQVHGGGVARGGGGRRARPGRRPGLGRLRRRRPAGERQEHPALPADGPCLRRGCPHGRGRRRARVPAWPDRRGRGVCGGPGALGPLRRGGRARPGGRRPSPGRRPGERGRHGDPARAGGAERARRAGGPAAPAHEPGRGDGRALRGGELAGPEARGRRRAAPSARADRALPHGRHRAGGRASRRGPAQGRRRAPRPVRGHLRGRGGSRVGWRSATGSRSEPWAADGGGPDAH